MAEIRKHNPEAGNAITQALRAAMGEPVRPNEPGARSAAPSSVPTSPVSSTTVVSFAVSTAPVATDDDIDDED
jgi:hypothetical protein